MKRAIGASHVVAACITGLLVFSPDAVFPQPEKASAAHTSRIVLLCTGTPSPDPERSGPATAVVVNGTPYLIDFGPGVVRRIAAASQQGVAGLGVVNVRVAFLTHLHSDHTAGYADLILTPWSVGRSQPLEVYGPKGLKHMTDHVPRRTGRTSRFGEGTSKSSAYRSKRTATKFKRMKSRRELSTRIPM
jgi:ribonuclease BN (tRNA processing enzyme)